MSVLPWKDAFGNKIIKSDGARTYVTESGGCVRDEASVRLSGYTDNWDEVSCEWRLTNPDVRKPLAAAVPICKAGNHIVLDLDTGSYVYNKKTRKYTPVYFKDGVFKFDLWVKQGLEPISSVTEEAVQIPPQTEHHDIGDVQCSACGASSGFPRRVTFRP